MSEELRELARKNPEAVKSVAEKAGGRIQKRLLKILKEENGVIEQ